MLREKKLDKTFIAWQAQQRAIAQGALTNSKHPKSFVYGVYPPVIKNSFGAIVTDCDGNDYIDYICGLGTNILGYGNVGVAAAIRDQLHFGLSPSLPTTHEEKTSNKLKEIFPFVDKFKFLKTGTEACMAAIRIARAHTKRFKVLSDGYHGWSDQFISLTPPGLGIPPQNGIAKLIGLNNIDDTIAAVIIEPVMTDYSSDRMFYLKCLKEICDEHGVVLIFDEIITGIRFSKYSVSNYCNIHPDLILLGKSIANGMPLAAVGGKAEIMDDNYFVSSTFAGEILSLAACFATIDLLQKDYRYSLSDMWMKGGAFVTEFNTLYPEKISILGYPTRGVFQGDDLTIALFFQESVKSGVLFGKSWFFNSSLIQYSNTVLNNSRDILSRIKQGQVKLEGAMPVSPLAVKIRNA